VKKAIGVLFLSAVYLCGNLSLNGQEFVDGARPNNWPEFVMSPEAKAAGIDGVITVGLTVSSKGTTSNIKLFGGPMWPCGIKEPEQVDEVRRAVRKFLESATFQPATKDGRPRSSDVQLYFSVSKSFADARDSKAIEENLRKGIFPPLVEVVNISRFATELPRLGGAVGSTARSILEIQVIVDEKGDVISAGTVRGLPQEVHEARRLGCSSKFKPLTYRDRPIKMTGRILFDIRR